MGEWKLLALGFLLFAAVEDSGGKVVNTVNEWKACCRGCPTLQSPWDDATRYKMICQYYRDSSHYATLFDTFKRIPVFSCFDITTDGSNNRHPTFDNEPQLIHPELSPNMMSESELRETKMNNRAITKDQIKQHQAVAEDYNGANYHRGHLNPSAGHRNPETVQSTYTYTNVVPQVGSFNQGCWKSLERRTRKYVMAECRDSHTVVVGAVPGNTWLKKDRVNRVNIPSYMWSYVICNRIVTAFFVPNEDNDHIKKEQLLTMFQFIDENESGVRDFLRHMRFLASDSSINSVREQWEKRLGWKNKLIDESVCRPMNRDTYYECQCTGPVQRGKIERSRPGKQIVNPRRVRKPAIRKGM